MNDIKDKIEMFKALGDITRFRILSLLSSSGNNLCVSALSKRLEISQPVISQHLKILKNTKIVSAKRIGNEVHYSIDIELLSILNEIIKTLIDFSSQKCTDDEFSDKKCD